MLPGLDAPERDPEAVTKGRFSEILGVTPGRVSQMITLGLPVRMDGKIDLIEGRAWFEANIRNRHSSQDTGDRAKAKADRERSEAELARMKVEEKSGRLVDANAVRLATFERARHERDAHLGFASRLASTIATELGCDPGRAYAILDREMRDHLARLADKSIDALAAETAAP